MHPKSEPRAGVAKARAALAKVAKSPRCANIEVKGEINAALAKSIKAQLAAAAGANTLRIVIDSPGGDLEAGYEIYQAIREHGARKKIADCYKTCASAALMIYLAADIRRAEPGAKLLMHRCEARPLTIDRKTAAWHTRMADRLRGLDDDAALLYRERTGAPMAMIYAELDSERFLPMRKAISMGLVHQVRGLTPPLDARWPAKAKAMMSGKDRFTAGAVGYMLTAGYLNACRLAGK
jgi:ATP-dependent Clp protease protease subunit